VSAARGSSIRVIGLGALAIPRTMSVNLKEIEFHITRIGDHVTLTARCQRTGYSVTESGRYPERVLREAALGTLDVLLSNRQEIPK
jgi:hypothetical protein